jgi:hypothetical protein
MASLHYFVALQKYRKMTDIQLVNSLSEFIEQIRKIQTAWTEQDGEYIYPWFRGHANEAYKLLPGLY